MNEPLLSIAGVRKNFGSVCAVDDVALAISLGERVALIGHNGAGKTTLIRLILGFIKPEAGSITVDGAAPGSDAARQIIAYLPESVTFPKTLTGREIIRFYAQLKSASRAEAEAALARVGLTEAANRRIGGYSKGMRQRLGLAQALVGTPRLMVLDEPTSGLDPVSRADFYALIDEIAASGCVVLLSSHSLDEIEARTDRVAILRYGQLVADASLADLQAKAALPIRIRIRAQPDAVEDISAHIGGTRVNGHCVELACSPSDKMARLQAIMSLGPAVTDLEVRLPSLDEIYRHFSTSGKGKAPS